MIKIWNLVSACWLRSSYQVFRLLLFTVYDFVNRYFTAVKGNLKPTVGASLLYHLKQAQRILQILQLFQLVYRTAILKGWGVRRKVTNETQFGRGRVLSLALPLRGTMHHFKKKI